MVPSWNWKIRIVSSPHQFSAKKYCWWYALCDCWVQRESPAKGPLKTDANINEIVNAYEIAGAKAISVLTEEDFFKGSSLDLLAARKATKLPLLRKDFIFDQYQIAESKALGADIILLIAAILKPEQVNKFSSYAQSLGLEVILEIHDPKN